MNTTVCEDNKIVMRLSRFGLILSLLQSLLAVVVLVLTTYCYVHASTLPEYRVSAADIIDFEFDSARDGVYCPTCNGGDGNARFAFTDRDYNLWVGYVDFQAGNFYPEDGKGVLVDTRAAFATDLGNGPEWMFSAKGSDIVYTKYFPGRKINTFTASVAIASMVDGSWISGIIRNGIKKQSPAATLGIDDLAPRINYQDYAKKKLFWRTVADPNSEELLPISEQTGGGSRRWVSGTHKIIYSGGVAPDENDIVYQQVFLYDTDTKELKQLTFDKTFKWGAFMWLAPEFDNEYVFFTVTDRTSISIYRNLIDEHGVLRWTAVNVISMPATMPYVWSPEPFVYNGRSYIFFQLSSNSKANDMSVPTQIAMTGIDPLHPSFRMLTNDSENRRVRMDPEYFITANGPYIYYNRYIPSTDDRKVINDGVWRVDTKL